jgi:uncharacterized protein YciI
MGFYVYFKFSALPQVSIFYRYLGMRNLVLFLLAILLHCSANAQAKYDKKLADSLGADEYGMKMYVMVVLKTGPAKITDKKVTDSLFRGHMDNIGRLVKEGKLTVAGPFEKNDKTYRGLFIFNVPTIEEAKALVVTDPTVKAGIFDVEYYQWYGSAALPAYLETSEKISKHTH